MIAANIDAVERAYRDTGLAEITKAADPAVAQEADDEFAGMRAALNGLISRDMNEVAKEPESWKRIHSLAFSIVRILIGVSNTVTKAADLPLSFNALDGD